MAKLKLKKPNLKSKKRPKLSLSFLKSSKFIASVLVILGLAGLGYSSFYWFDEVHSKKENVFYGMLDKSLNTSSVMRSSEQADPNRKESQQVQLVFSPDALMNSVTKLEQVTTQARDTSTVVTETIGNRDVDFVQYTEINIPASEGDTTDYGRVLNTWAKRDGQTPEGDNQAQFLNEAAFTFVPFGNFPADKRAELVSMMRDTRVYDIRTMTIRNDNGRRQLVGTVSINPKKFVEAMRKYAELTGVGDLRQLDPEQYEDGNVFSIDMRIDVMTRQLVEITYGDGERIEKYYAYGANRHIQFPDNSISLEELQARVQQN